jgi:hypothetical protein
VNTQQQPDETREEFVRRNWNRPGVVANGQTLLDLYARIAKLEHRVSELESARDSSTDK